MDLSKLCDFDILNWLDDTDELTNYLLAAASEDYESTHALTATIQPPPPPPPPIANQPLPSPLMHNDGPRRPLCRCHKHQPHPIHSTLSPLPCPNFEFCSARQQHRWRPFSLLYVLKHPVNFPICNLEDQQRNSGGKKGWSSPTHATRYAVLYEAVG